MLEKSARQLAQRNPWIRRTIILLEFVLKRTLATLLWLTWRSGLYPFRSLRGKMYTPGRFYIDRFIKQYAPECAGQFLEFGEPEYRALFDPGVVERYDIIDVVPHPGVNIVADIQACPEIDDNSYDVIVCTQVLEHVQNPSVAVGELRRILKPGGRLLLTVPAAYPYHAVPQDYWRFTKDSMHLLFAEGFTHTTITGHGNRLTATANYWFWMYDHLPRRALLQPDPDNPSLLSVYARK